MLASPWVLLHGLRRGWLGLLIGSTLLWAAAQFGLEAAAYDAVARFTGIAVPFGQTGAFDLPAWQFLWMLGLAIGAGGLASGREQPGRPHFPRWWLHAALAVGLIAFGWRHWRSQAPFEHWQQLNVLFDKWHLGPLRLINFLALLTLVVHYGPAIAARIPRLRFLELLGAASLPVFCAHLVVVLLSLAVLGPVSPGRPAWIDAALLAGTFAVLYAVAKVSQLGADGVAALWARRQPAAPVNGSAR